MEDLDFELGLVLHLCFEREEGIRSLRLLFEEIYDPEPCSIINKDHKVSVTLRRCNWHGTMQIHMHNLKRSGRTHGSLVDDPVLLSSKAWFTEGLSEGWSGRWIYVEASDEFLRVHPLQILVVDV